jgi:hypothetical protein
MELCPTHSPVGRRGEGCLKRVASDIPFGNGVDNHHQPTVSSMMIFLDVEALPDDLQRDISQMRELDMVYQGRTIHVNLSLPQPFQLCKTVTGVHVQLKSFFRKNERNWSLDRHISPKKGIICQKKIFDQYSKMFD